MNADHEDAESSSTPSPHMPIDDYYSKPEDYRRLWADRWLDVFRAGQWCSGEPPLPPPIDKQFDQYHPYACFACKRGPFTNTTLKTCTQCKVVKYCSREHQKADWPSHKAWCKAFVSMRNDGDYRALLKPANADMDTWRLHTSRLTAKVNLKVGARLHTTEVQLVAMQPRCRKCLVAGCSPDVELVTCPRCHGVALCKNCYSDCQVCNAHEQFHGDGGVMECDGHLISLSCTGMVVEQGSPLCIESDTDVEECFLPKDWIEYLERKRDDFMSLPHPMTLMAPVVAFITDGLSLPLTILYALGHSAVLGRDKVPSMTRLVVHLVGASANEELGITKFLELIRLVPSLTYLRIVSIGPDIEDVYGFPSEGRPLNFTNPDMSKIRDGCDARVLRRTGYYHDVGDLDEPPTLVFAGHPGIDDSNYTENWRPTVERVASQDVPFVITGYNRNEVLADRNKLKEFGANVVVGPTANPFRGLRPFLDPMRDSSDFIYTNSHLVITRGYQ